MSTSGGEGEPFMERLALASARIPFRVKVVAVWVVIFTVLALFCLAAGFDRIWIKDNLALHRRRAAVHHAYGDRRHRDRDRARDLGLACPDLEEPDRLRHLRVLRLVLPRHAADRADVPRSTSRCLPWAPISWRATPGSRTASRTRSTSTSTTAGDWRARPELRRLHDRDLPGRASSRSPGDKAEAADALGMTHAQKMRKVVLPQAFRVIIPPTGNEFIAMMKDTALVSFLGSTSRRMPRSSAARSWSASATSRTSRPTSPPRCSTGCSPPSSRSSSAGSRPGSAAGTCVRRGTQVAIAYASLIQARGRGSRDMSEREVVVRVEGLHKSFGRLEVVKGVDMEVRRGEVVVIFGRSGLGEVDLVAVRELHRGPDRGRHRGGRCPGWRRPPHQAQAREDPTSCGSTSAWCSSSSTCSRT